MIPIEPQSSDPDESRQPDTTGLAKYSSETLPGAASNFVSSVEEEVGDPTGPGTEATDDFRSEMEHMRRARRDLARWLFWLTASVFVSIGIVLGAAVFALIVGDSGGVDAAMARHERMMETATFMATSLLPAAIGVFGSVVGYYFGSQTAARSRRDPE